MTHDNNYYDYLISVGYIATKSFTTIRQKKLKVNYNINDFFSFELIIKIFWLLKKNQEITTKTNLSK